MQVVQSFKYLGINGPLTNRWNVCYGSKLQVGLITYNIFENECNRNDTRGWEVRLMFNAMLLLYGAEV